MSENVKQNREFVAQLKQCLAQDLSRVIGEVDDLRQCVEILEDDFYDRSTIDEMVSVAVKLNQQLVVRLISQDDFMPVVPVNRLEDFHKWLNCDHYWSERFNLSGCGSKENNDE